MVAVVVLWFRKVRQQANVRNGLEQEKRTCAAQFANVLHRASFAGFHRKEKWNDAVIESPVAFVVALFDEFDREQKIFFNLCKALRAAIDLDTRNAQWQSRAVVARANNHVRRPVEA